MKNELYTKSNPVSNKDYLQGINSAFNHWSNNRKLFPEPFLSYISDSKLKYRLHLAPDKSRYYLISLLCLSSQEFSSNTAGKSQAMQVSQLSEYWKKVLLFQNTNNKSRTLPKSSQMQLKIQM